MAIQKNSNEPKPDRFHSIMISSDPNHDEAKGPQYIPVRMQGTEQVWDPCPDCGGSGKSKTEVCSTCKGVGRVPIFETCIACNGDKIKRTDRGVLRCGNCDGQGMTAVQTAISKEIYIPRGTIAHNIAQWAIDVLRRAVETHYSFVKKNREDKEMAMVGSRRPSYPFQVIRTYDKQLTDKEIKAFDQEV